MPALLFSDFFPASKDSWEKIADKELKGQLKELSDWNIGSNIHFEPYLTEADTDAARLAGMQACQKKIPGWQNMPEVKFEAPFKTNAAIKHALENGADAIILDLGDTDLIHCEFPKLLHGIRLSDTPIYFRTAQNAENLFREISKNAGYYLKGGIAMDPIAHVLRTGTAVIDQIKSIATVLNQTRNMREFRVCMIDGNLYHNNGADQVQELALMIAATADYMDLITDEGIAPLTAFNRIIFSTSIGTEYLTEIAKIRALRYLLRRFSDAYQLPFKLCSPFIHARTSGFYQSWDAPHTNMIRASSEAMSAVIGGCNALTVTPYDAPLQDPSNFSARIARNVSSVLAHESGLAQVADPAAGSYMLETMSQQLAEHAWELFLEIEEKGGFMQCVESGFIQKQLNVSLEKKLNDLNSGKVMIGVNKFHEPGYDPNPSENAGENSKSKGTMYMDDQNLAQCFRNSMLTSSGKL